MQKIICKIFPFYVEILFFNNYLLRYYPSISQFSCYLKA